MDDRKIPPIQFVFIGVIVGMAIVFGAYMLFKSNIAPEKVKKANVSTNLKSGQERELCPVCKKPVNPATDFSEELYGKKFHFCSEICQRAFDAEPMYYLKDMKVNINIELLPQEDEPTQEPPTSSETVTPQENSQPPETQSDEGDSEQSVDATPSTNLDSVPMPDEIPLDTKPDKIKNKAKSNKLQEIPLTTVDKPKASKSKPAKSHAKPKKSSEIEELPLNSPSSGSASAPSSDSKGDMEIEEIPLN